MVVLKSSALSALVALISAVRTAIPRAEPLPQVLAGEGGNLSALVPSPAARVNADGPAGPGQAFQSSSQSSLVEDTQQEGMPAWITLAFIIQGVVEDIASYLGSDQVAIIQFDRETFGQQAGRAFYLEGAEPPRKEGDLLSFGGVAVVTVSKAAKFRAVSHWKRITVPIRQVAVGRQAFIPQAFDIALPIQEGATPGCVSSHRHLTGGAIWLYEGGCHFTDVTDSNLVTLSRQACQFAEGDQHKECQNYFACAFKAVAINAQASAGRTRKWQGTTKLFRSRGECIVEDSEAAIIQLDPSTFGRDDVWLDDVDLRGKHVSHTHAAGRTFHPSSVEPALPHDPRGLVLFGGFTVLRVNQVATLRAVTHWTQTEIISVSAGSLFFERGGDVAVTKKKARAQPARPGDTPGCRKSEPLAGGRIFAYLGDCKFVDVTREEPTAMARELCTSAGTNHAACEARFECAMNSLAQRAVKLGLPRIVPRLACGSL